MSDYCRACRYNHKQRTGNDACRSISSTGAFSASTRPPCGLIPAWAATYWACASWTQTNGRRCAAKHGPFWKSWTTY